MVTLRSTSTRSEHHSLDRNTRVDRLLYLCDGLAGVEALGAHRGAIHDGLAAVQLERIVDVRQPLACHVIPA